MGVTTLIPRKLSVGYKERSDTYTGKLAYITYTDHKNVLRKATSWNSWRNDKIDADEFTNEPTEGFVLNKKAGGGTRGWDARKTYTRVYDPRGFEFEIQIPNLLYILENVNCMKGKGLEGEFVYGWDGTELLLIPVDAPDYKAMMDHSNVLFSGKTFKGKDLILGATYKSNTGAELVYLGRFDYFSDGRRFPNKKVPKRYFFRDIKSDYSWERYIIITTLKNRVISVIDENPVHNYAELMDKLESESIYSPLDPSQYKYIPMSYTDLNTYKSHCYVSIGDAYVPVYATKYIISPRFTAYGDKVSAIRKEFPATREHQHYYYRDGAANMEKLCAKYPLFKSEHYLENGKKSGGDA